MKHKKCLFLWSSLILLQACSPSYEYQEVHCDSTTGDSVENSDASIDAIGSAGQGRYFVKTLPRTTAAAEPVTMDYMVHGEANDKGFMVLIPGGTMDAGISGVDGQVVSSAGRNSLVRSAHLFAAQGFKVLTIDRPSDYAAYTQGSSSGSSYDGYRTSAAHASDLSFLINEVNDTHLPVVIVGTSRGGISAVAQNGLADMLVLTNPVTGGSNGFPVGSSKASPGKVGSPTLVVWHKQDACRVSPPGGSKGLLGDIADVTGVELDGGYAGLTGDECGGLSYHGFAGIETCMVEHIVTPTTTTIEGLQAGVLWTTTHDLNATIDGAEISFDLSTRVNASALGFNSLELVFPTSSLGAELRLEGNAVFYTPPAGISSGAKDSFTFVVKDASGNRSHNVIAVTLSQ